MRFMEKSPAMRQILFLFWLMLAGLSLSAQSSAIWKQTGVRVNQTDLQAQKARCLPHCSFSGHADDDGMQYRYAHRGADGKTHVYSGHVRFDWQSSKGMTSLTPGETVSVSAYVTNQGDAGHVSAFAVAGKNGFMKPRGGKDSAPVGGNIVMEGTFPVPRSPAQRPDGSIIPTWEITFTLTGGNETRFIERIITYTWQPVTGQTNPTPETTASAVAVKTDQSTYGKGDPVTVRFSGLPGNTRDWIGIYKAGTDGRAYLSWQYTGGRKEGQLTFNPPGEGEYVLIAYENDGYRELGRSGVIRVGTTGTSGQPEASVPTGGASVRTDKASYRAGETITVIFTDIAGYPKDWIGIYGAQAYHANEYIEWKYTEGRKDGTMTFQTPRTGAGNYRIRVYENNGYKLLAESAEFRVGN